MPSVTIRDVPAEVRNELAARAAGRGQSMQEFLRAELVRIVEKPTVEEVIARARERVRRLGDGLSADEILAARDADRP
jgi:plasmid stability protein